MKRRLKSKTLASQVRGKSGSLSGTTSLTGVVYSADYGWVSYAFMFNHQAKNNWDLIEIEDAILSLFI